MRARARRRWIVLGYVVMQISLLVAYGAAIAYLAVGFADTRARQIAKEEADAAAGARAEVTVCRRAAATYPQTRAILLALIDDQEQSIDATEGALAADPGSPASRSREISIARRRAALFELEVLLERAERERRTKQECSDLARKLGVGIRSTEEEEKT